MRASESNILQWTSVNIMNYDKDSFPPRYSYEAMEVKENCNERKVKMEFNEFKKVGSTESFNQKSSWESPSVNFHIDKTNSKVMHASIKEIQKPKIPSRSLWTAIGCDHKWKNFF